MRTHVLLLGSLLVTAACSGGGGSSDAGYVLPQIVPDNNPVCLTYQRTFVGQSYMGNVILENEGKQTLQISSSTIANDARHDFKLLGVNAANGGMNMACVNGTPCPVGSFESAFAEFTYAPTSPGWDAVALEIRSNAGNYPVLGIFILARAEPPIPDGGATMPYDAGDPPASAMMSSCLGPAPDAGHH
jgi:hypothetical protein